MTLIYSKKENPYIYFTLSIILLGVFFAGVYYTDYYLWIIIPAFVFTLVKGIRIMKIPEVPVILLNKDGLTMLPERENTTSFYAFQDIESVKMQSNYFNGYIKLKGIKRKVILDSVAIPIDKQQEIVRFVTNKIENT